MDPNGGGAGTSTCSEPSWENMTAPTGIQGARMTRDNCYKTHGREADGR